MRRLIARHCALAVVLVTLCADAVAQEPPEPFLLLEVSRECATAEEDQQLLDAIELRIPDAFVVRGAVEDAEPDWRVTWRPRSDEKCELLFSSRESRSAMTLGPHPGGDEIRLAASRVAWLASVTPTRKRPEETTVEDELSALGPETDPPVEPEPEPEPQDETAKVELEEPPEPEELPPPEEPPEPDPEEPEPEEPEEQLPPEPKPEPKEPSAPEFTRVGTKIALLPGAVLTPRPVPDRAVPKFSFNLIGGSNHGLDGYEIGGLWNHEREFANGVQFAFGANLVDGKADAVQLAFGFNRADTLRGIQVGSLNLAGDTEGLQLGLMNIAGPVDGAQVGIFNLAERANVSLGLVNVMFQEPVYVTGRASQTGLTFGIEHGSRLFRWSYLAGIDPFTPATSWRLGFGPGLRFSSETVYLDLDALIHAVVRAGDPIFRTSQLLEGRVSVGYRILPRFAVYAGVSGKALVTGLIEGAELAPDYALTEPGPSLATTTHVWPEIHLGVRF